MNIINSNIIIVNIKRTIILSKYSKNWLLILFDENGASYATGSFGIFNILGRILEVFGTPDTWSEPLKVRVVKKDIQNNRKMLSLELI